MKIIVSGKIKGLLLDGRFKDTVLQEGNTVEFIYFGDEEC